MRRLSLGLALTALACNAPSQDPASRDTLAAAPAAPAADPAAEEQAIRAINERWVAAVASGDTATIGGIYAEDGLFMSPNAPLATGRAAIVQGWAAMMAAPGVALTFNPTDIEVASGGDMAWDVGVYQYRSGEGASAVADTGKYLVVWEKQDGQWRVVADMFNSDRPAP
jgi:uncharacterized protein (TIGR02246 family)